MELGAGDRRVSSEGLTIRDVARRTGVESATLRMWEQRYGFPEPERLPSGHRRYSNLDVELIGQVVPRPRGRPEPQGRHRAGQAGRARRAPRDRGRLHLLRPAPPPVATSSPSCCPSPPWSRHQPRDRGRVRRALVQGDAVRLLPARALLPPGRAALARPGQGLGVRLRAGRLRRGARARRRPRSRCRSTPPSPWAASGRCVYDAPDFGARAQRLGAPRPGRDARPGPLLRDALERRSPSWCATPPPWPTGSWSATSPSWSRGCESPARPARATPAAPWISELTGLTNRIVAYVSGSATPSPAPRSS